VYGRTASTGGYGVYALTSATTGSTFAVYGRANSTSGTGVVGAAMAASGTTTGVYGYSASPAGFAVVSDGRLKVNGRSYLAAPATGPADTDLSNGSVSLYLDETNNTLKVRVKYSGGTLKTATITLA